MIIITYNSQNNNNYRVSTTHISTIRNRMRAHGLSGGRAKMKAQPNGSRKAEREPQDSDRGLDAGNAAVRRRVVRAARRISFPFAITEYRVIRVTEGRTTS